MRAYIVTNKWDPDQGSICVLADSRNEAKTLAFKDDRMSDGEYIDLRVTVCKGGDITGLEHGVLDDDLDCLKRELYGVLFNCDCPNCGAQDTHVSYDNGFSCSECEDDD